MFRSARLKLTAWYLLMIMAVSIAFSFGLYRLLSGELTRFERVQRLRIERGLSESNPQGVFQLPETPELVEEAESRIFWALIFINLGILTVSSAIGYFLAGRTLAPIAEMVDEQNRFITDASHELRTPLTSLKSAMEVNLRDKNFSIKDARVLISESIDEVDKLQLLTEGLLGLTSFDKPNNHIKMQIVTISDILERAIARVKPMAAAKRIKIENNVKNHKVLGDTKMLIDLFVIFLDNAIKYSHKKGTVVVSSVKNDGKITVSVADLGIGISEKDLPHIFDRFYRADSARSREASGGWGLGLPIAKSIVDMFDGTIKVESKADEGTTFFITLPGGKS